MCQTVRLCVCARTGAGEGVERGKPGIEEGAKEHDLRHRVERASSVTTVAGRAAACREENNSVAAQLNVGEKIRFCVRRQRLMCPRVHLHLLEFGHVDLESARHGCC